ncbi:2,3-dihydro-2,3-dihydroxybenzoate dehydrogenase [Larsenimonas suaedae]|uniref:2,3-dihydro-2,3-dihydroxybenzoate dehydrogenase n=1 Tax=Larsenimonas suaedae TaxID=1851019 RepID=A0ABU1GU05_9GAMM|nr:2,3-dihydro-2,3-dihydroxybenzoate dehydrogenase [Larsenimonas suaedae]MCM2972148.1 2,3-dihydro-2,3-dihydroxybenzoate dehydrogenase [Larsenimonas suaedae]MDR5895056.1 2,3-dihydro-2,3-dihydroxybenzoate dehydrogenase [Larsenimonas suaedae]
MTQAFDQQFSGRVVLVSGAAQGIGRTLMERLLHAGAHVAALDIDAKALALAAGTLNAGDRLSVHGVDVSDPAAVEHAVAAAETHHGRIDHLACVAGTLQMGRLLELSDAQWQNAFRVNTDGVFYLTRAVGKRMMTRREGSVVVVSSNAASTPRMSMGAYCASKAAATQMTRCLGLELAEYGIRCNVVSPGSTDTEMLHGMWQSPADRDTTLEGSLETYKAGIPLKRIAAPDDICEGILYLLSDSARHITLHDLRLDGGATLGQI